MATILIINGAETHPPLATGQFNTHLFETAKQKLDTSHTILTTVVSEGYDIANERQKYLQADIVIVQFPVFWFAVPSSLKQYIDDIYTAPGVFFGHGEYYGRGGLLTDKHYMFSMTWNAKSSDFNSDTTLLGERSVDDVLVSLHLTQQYVGLKPIASFAEHDVVRTSDIEGAAQRLRDHLDRYVVDL